MFVPLFTCMIGIVSSLCSAPLDPSHPMHLFRSLSCPFCARLKCHFPLWTNRVQNDIWYFDFEMLAGLPNNHQQQVTDQFRHHQLWFDQESLQRSSWDRYQKHCQKRDDEMPNVRHNALVSRNKKNDIHDILLVLKCQMSDGEIQHFDGEIGILDAEQQKNMIVNSQFLMVSFLNFNLVVLIFCSSCLNPHNWASFQHAIFVCRWHKFLMWVSMWYMWWCLREVANICTAVPVEHWMPPVLASHCSHWRLRKQRAQKLRSVKGQDQQMLEGETQLQGCCQVIVHEIAMVKE